MTNIVRRDSFSIKRSGNVSQDCDTLRSALQTRDQDFEAGLKMLFPNTASAEPAPEPEPAAPAQRMRNGLASQPDVETVRARMRMSMPTRRR